MPGCLVWLSWFLQTLSAALPSDSASAKRRFCADCCWRPIHSLLLHHTRPADTCGRPALLPFPCKAWQQRSPFKYARDAPHPLDPLSHPTLAPKVPVAGPHGCPVSLETPLKNTYISGAPRPIRCATPRSLPRYLWQADVLASELVAAREVRCRAHDLAMASKGWNILSRGAGSGAACCFDDRRASTSWTSGEVGRG